MAKAEADALLTLTDAEIEADDRRSRALTRFVQVETRRQQNVEAIADGALDLLPPGDPEQTPHTDWMHRFFDACKDVGNEDMQRTWSRILAGEFSAVGSYSYRLLDAPRLISPDEAIYFRRFCNSAVSFAGGPLALPHWKPLLESAQEWFGPHSYALLTEVGPIADRSIPRLDSLRVLVSYGSHWMQIEDQRLTAHLSDGYQLTQVGAELARVVAPAHSALHWQTITEAFVEHGWKVWRTGRTAE